MRTTTTGHDPFNSILENPEKSYSHTIYSYSGHDNNNNNNNNIQYPVAHYTYVYVRHIERCVWRTSNFLAPMLVSDYNVTAGRRVVEVACRALRGACRLFIS